MDFQEHLLLIEQLRVSLAGHGALPLVAEIESLLTTTFPSIPLAPVAVNRTNVLLEVLFPAHDLASDLSRQLEAEKHENALAASRLLKLFHDALPDALVAASLYQELSGVRIDANAADSVETEKVTFRVKPLNERPWKLPKITVSSVCLLLIVLQSALLAPSLLEAMYKVTLVLLLGSLSAFASARFPRFVCLPFLSRHNLAYLFFGALLAVSKALLLTIATAPHFTPETRINISISLVIASFILFTFAPDDLLTRIEALLP